MASSLDPENVTRSPESKPIRVFEFDVIGTGQTIVLPKPVNGVVQSIASKCKTLTTDTTYTITVKDKDGNPRFTKAGIAHAGTNFENFVNGTTANEKPFLAYGMMTVEIVFPATSQTLVAGDLQVFLETTKH